LDLPRFIPSGLGSSPPWISEASGNRREIDPVKSLLYGVTYVKVYPVERIYLLTGRIEE
jgi:hypothetical protein